MPRNVSSQKPARENSKIGPTIFDHPLHKIWRGIGHRCRTGRRSASTIYQGVVLDPRWRDYRAFYHWAMENGWEAGLYVDKDIRSFGSRTYGPDTCLLVTPQVNSAAAADPRIGPHPAGVSWSGATGRVRAQIKRYGGKVHLGYFDDPVEAFHAYCAAKETHLIELAVEQVDQRVRRGLEYLAGQYRYGLLPYGPDYDPEHQGQRRAKPPTDRTCPECGSTFSATGKRKYCSEECSRSVINERTRAWQRANPERARASTLRWQKANPEKLRAAAQRRSPAKPWQPTAKMRALLSRIPTAPIPASDLHDGLTVKQREAQRITLHRMAEHGLIRIENRPDPAHARGRNWLSRL